MRKNLACMDWISACILTVSDFSQKSFPWKLLKVNAFKFLTLYNFFMCADPSVVGIYSSADPIEYCNSGCVLNEYICDCTWEKVPFRTYNDCSV